MHAAIFMGTQGSGKSTFYKATMADTHIRLNLDMLRTRHREGLLLRACLEAKQPFVIDNTNPTRAERSVYLAAARGHGFRTTGYFFKSVLADCLARNDARPAPVPRPGVLGTHARLEMPSRDEGFDELFFVAIRVDGGFDVSPWRDDEGTGAGASAGPGPPGPTKENSP